MNDALATLKKFGDELTVNQRMGVVLAGMALCLGTLTYFPQIAAGVFVTVTSLSLTKKFTSRLRALSPTVWPQLRVYSLQASRLSNSLLSAPPAIEFLYVTALLLISVTLPFSWYFRDIRSITYVGRIFFVFLCIAGILDLGHQVFRFTRMTWARTIGKVFLTFIGSVLLYVASAIAKQIAHEITSVDPKYFSDFVGCLTAMSMPVFYLGSGIVVLALWTLFHSVITGTIFALQSLKESLLTGLAFWKLDRKKAPNFDFRRVVSMTRIASMAVAVSFISETYTGLFLKNEKYITSNLEKLIVIMEYRKQGDCNNLSSEERYSYMDDGKISVATKTNDHYRFSSRTCMKE